MKKIKRDYIAKLVIYGLPEIKEKDLIRLRNWIDSFDFCNSKVNQKYSKLFTARLMK